MYRFEIFRDSSRQYRFRFVSPNNEIMFQSESYTRKSKAKEAILSIMSAFGVLDPFKINVDFVIYNSIPRKPNKNKGIPTKAK